MFSNLTEAERNEGQKGLLPSLRVEEGELPLFDEPPDEIPGPEKWEGYEPVIGDFM